MWSHGRWYIIHQTALWLNRNPAKFTRWMRRSVIPYLECEKCRSHAQEYISKFPPNSPVFRWSVDFHNHVNKQLDKPIISEIYARKLVNGGYKQSTLYEGIWRSIHSTSCTNDMEDNDFFKWWLPKVINSLPNDVYNRNATSYLRSNPITFDPFIWAYKFHEALKFNGNPMKLQEAVHIWRNRNNKIDCPHCKA